MGLGLRYPRTFGKCSRSGLIPPGRPVTLLRVCNPAFTPALPWRPFFRELAGGGAQCGVSTTTEDCCLEVNGAVYEAGAPRHFTLPETLRYAPGGPR